MDMRVIDTVDAHTLADGDYVSIKGHTGEVLDIVDEGAEVIITLSAEDEYGDKVEVRLLAYDAVDLLYNDYTGIEA